MKHSTIERNVGLLIVLTVVAVSFGGIVEMLPLLFERQITKPMDGLEPLPPLALEGRDIYIREGCHVCHTQMVRTLQFETARYGHYSVAGEDAYERPFLWGSKRTGPDLARVGGRYSNEWHFAHLADPRALVPSSNMPAYPWLFDNVLDGADIVARMRVLRTLGTPYTQAAMDAAVAQVSGHSEADALVVYLQSLGVDMQGYDARAQARTGQGE